MTQRNDDTQHQAPTPRTDAAVDNLLGGDPRTISSLRADDVWFMRDHARQLERELAEALIGHAQVSALNQRYSSRIAELLDAARPSIERKKCPHNDAIFCETPERCEDKGCLWVWPETASAPSHVATLKPYQHPGEADVAPSVQEAIRVLMQNFGEIPDRTSPDDFPESYVLTREEIVGGILKIVGADREARSATPPASIVKDAKLVKEMLELGDSRLLASDGPAGGQLPDLSPDEWGKVYRACKRIAAMDGGTKNADR